MARLDRLNLTSSAGEDAIRPIVLALVFAIGIVSQSALGDDPPPGQPPMPVPRHAEEQTSLSKDQLDNLKMAAEHLAKAGRKEDADKLREQIAAIESGQAKALLAKKERELDALEAEVQQLRYLTGRQPQIQLAFQIFEASRARLKDADVPNIELLYPRGGVKSGSLGPVQHTTIAVDNSAALKETIEALRKKELIKVLAEPTLVTVSGRQVSFNSGGEFPVVLPQAHGTTSLEYRQFGTRVDALPVLIGGGKVSLQLRAKVSEVDAARGVTINGSTIPGLRERFVDTSAELRFGEALVLNGPPQVRHETQKDAKGKMHGVSDEIEMVVVITPAQIDAPHAVVLPNPARTGYYVEEPRVSDAVGPKVRK